MRETGVVATILLMAGILAACTAPEGTAPKVDLAAEEQAVLAQSARWLELARAKDLATLVDEMYIEEGETIFDGKILRGRAAILADAENSRAENPDSTIDWTTSRVEIAAAGDIAIERGSWTYDPDGDGEKPSERGEFMTFWKKVDGTWRCAVDSGSTIKETSQ